MMKLVAATALAGALAYGALANEQKEPRIVHWSFDGMLGTLDKPSAQRGLQVYKEVCAACHGLSRIAFRNLAEIGFTPGEIKALAATYTVKDGPNDAGDLFDRPGLPSDRFVPPFANENAARAANNGAYPPDLSLITKARHNGPSYIHSLLTGYEKPPADVAMPEGMHYNPYFPGGMLAMPQPIGADGQVAYEDGTPATVDQMSRDVVTFLQWAAEPEMEARKAMGLKVMLYLAVFTGFMYMAMKRVWKKLH